MPDTTAPNGVEPSQDVEPSPRSRILDQWRANNPDGTAVADRIHQILDQWRRTWFAENADQDLEWRTQWLAKHPDADPNGWLDAWLAQNPDADLPPHTVVPRSVRRTINRLLREHDRRKDLNQHAGAFQRFEARSRVQGRIRRFHDKVAAYQISERDRLYQNMSSNNYDPDAGPTEHNEFSPSGEGGSAAPGTTEASSAPDVQPAAEVAVPFVPAAQDIELPGFLVEEREEIAQEISSMAGLTAQDQARARMVLHIPYDRSRPVFLPDRKLAMDVVRYRVDQLRQSMSNGMSRMRTTVADATAQLTTKIENVSASVIGDGNRQQQTTEVSPHTKPLSPEIDTPATQLSTEQRSASLVEWVTELRERPFTDLSTTSNITAALSERISGVDWQLADRAMIITNAILKDACQRTRFDRDPRQLMLDDGSYRQWEDEQTLATAESTTSSPTANDLDPVLMSRPPLTTSVADTARRADNEIRSDASDPAPAPDAAVGAGV
ncbi:hypothetical protein [Nocardia sp. XZ_19_369]|uniref:hypothetical protein n=1 Tax=Nocardia sp. XZ_19_369 TaxID=2769487 RepID=UPI0018908A64|nr:hypothetical protein [Nocardia sp. XZ_19_369]